MSRELVLILSILSTACAAERPAPTSGAAPGPVQHAITGVFEGHYERAFELSRFLPCGGAVIDPDGRRVEVLSAWASFQGDASEQVRSLPPDRGEEIVARHARFHGTLRGPGCYGHMGLALFQLEVDRIDELDPTQDPACDHQTLRAELDARAADGRPFPCLP